MVYTYSFPSPLGEMILVSDGTALTGLWFAGQRHLPPLPSPQEGGEILPVFVRTLRWLDDYFSGRAPGEAPPVRLEGTVFRREVWALLTEIPYGQTVSYGELARRLSERRGGSCVSARAVGGAVGHNPVSLIVPCHRVVGADGSLTGYAGGVERKEKLLALERAVLKADSFASLV